MLCVARNYIRSEVQQPIRCAACPTVLEVALHSVGAQWFDVSTDKVADRTQWKSRWSVVWNALDGALRQRFVGCVKRAFERPLRRIGKECARRFRDCCADSMQCHSMSTNKNPSFSGEAPKNEGWESHNLRNDRVYSEAFAPSPSAEIANKWFLSAM